METQITVEQIKAQYAKNAKQLYEMAEKAKSLGGKNYRGKPYEFWLSKAKEYELKSK